MLDNRIIRFSANPGGFGQVADSLDEQMFMSELPTQHTHLYYENDDMGLYVGVWDTTAMIEGAGPYSCDEFMWLLEGEVEIKNSKTGVSEKIVAGEAFIIPRGYDCQWRQGGYLRKFFVIVEDPNEALPQSPVYEGVIKPQVDVPTPTIDNSEPSAVGGARVCYEERSGKFSAGIWESEPFEAAMCSMPDHQFVYLLEGALSVTDEDNVEHHFKAGDAFFLPQGTVCRWSATERVRTTYAIVRSTPNKETTANTQGINNE